MQTFAGALLAKVVTGVRTFNNHLPERIGTQEPNERIELTYTVLERSTREAPAVLGLQREGGFSSIGGTLLDIVRLIEHNADVRMPSAASPIPLEGVHWALLFDEHVATFEAALLPTERCF